jgi:hypothetical protein
MGEQLHEMRLNGERGGGRRKKELSGKTLLTLGDLGLTKTQSSHWQRLAKLPIDLQEEKVESAKAKVHRAIDGPRATAV